MSLTHVQRDFNPRPVSFPPAPGPLPSSVMSESLSSLCNFVLCILFHIFKR